MIEKLDIKNRQIQRILSNSESMYFGDKCRIRGFVENEYELVKNYSVSESYLQRRLHTNKINIEHSYSMIIGESEGGSYVLDSLRTFLNFDNYYTAGYYPKGYVGWHDDVDINGYYIMLTYCTSNTGFFRYRDPETEEIITCNDEIGWLAKGVKLGTSEKEILWHCAVSDTPRYTFLLHYTEYEKYNTAKKILTNE